MHPSPIAARLLGPLLAALALLAAGAVPARAGPAPRRMFDVSLGRALMLMPDTPAIRAAGVWYADYARAERVYGLDAVTSTADPRIGRLFQSIVALRPGPETGAPTLSTGTWRASYGFDLLYVDSEIYSTATIGHDLSAATGRMDTLYVAHVLATAGYSSTVNVHERLFTRTPQAPPWVSQAPMNAVAVGPHLLVTGTSPDDVRDASGRLQYGIETLGLDTGYRALADALGPVQGAYVAANVPPPLPEPAGGHSGPLLHPFGLYAVAYDEPRPGHRYLDLALYYRSQTDASADVPTLQARLTTEATPTMNARWAQLVRLAGIAVRGHVLLMRLALAANVPPTLWQNLVTSHGLTILSR